MSRLENFKILNEKILRWYINHRNWFQKRRKLISFKLITQYLSIDLFIFVLIPTWILISPWMCKWRRMGSAGRVQILPEAVLKTNTSLFPSSAILGKTVGQTIFSSLGRAASLESKLWIQLLGECHVETTFPTTIMANQNLWIIL